MTVVSKVSRGAVIAGSLGVLAACNEAGSDLLTPTSSSDIAAATASGGAGQAGDAQTQAAGPLAAFVRVTCEKDVPPRALRSKISVDGNNLNRGRYRARVSSPPGSNPVVSALKPTVGDEVEFDFDSQVDPGETPIAPNYIQIVNGGPDVLGEILDQGGRVVARQAAECEIDN